jgi:branched-chain amino acid transport system permease protein
MAGIYALLGTGLNILAGYTGQVSLGQAAFYGIGAYVSGLLNVNLGLPFIVTLPIAVIVAAVFGVVLAIPALKVKGSYLALLTIGFGEITRMVLVNWKNVTRGPAGVIGIKAPSIFGFQFDTLQKYYFLILFFVVLGTIYQNILIRSRPGRAFIAIMEDSKAAELIGIDITWYKIKSFVISAVYSAIAGVLYAHMINYISPDTFTSYDSSLILWIVIIGGLGYLPAPILGAIVMSILPEALRWLGNWRLVIYGVTLTLVIMYYPGGLAKYLSKLYFSAKRKLSESAR